MQSQISGTVHRLLGLAAAFSLALASAAAFAQSGPYPNRAIRIIVPYSAGTGSDVLARTIGQNMTEKTGQPVVVENRDGGGSLIGTMAVAKSPPDGYTILIVANPFVIVPSHSAKPHCPWCVFQADLGGTLLQASFEAQTPRGSAHVSRALLQPFDVAQRWAATRSRAPPLAVG